MLLSPVAEITASLQPGSCQMAKWTLVYLQKLQNFACRGSRKAGSGKKMEVRFIIYRGGFVLSQHASALPCAELIKRSRLYLDVAPRLTT